MDSYEHFVRLVEQEIAKQYQNTKIKPVESNFRSLPEPKVNAYEFQQVRSNSDEKDMAYLLSLHDHLFISEAFLLLLPPLLSA